MELLQHLLPGMRAQGWGRVISIGSIQELAPSAEMPIYAMTKAALENLVRKRGLEGIVRIVDHCNDMAAAYMLADVVVSASTDPEAFGRVVAEAQAMGRPVVAPEHGGAPEILKPGETGWLFRAGDSDGLAEAHARAIRGVWEAAGRPAGLRLLFSAHGLPERVVAGGDPYQAQVEATAAAVAAHLPEFTDWKISYQSRVGPLKWIGPSTDDEIRQAGAEGVGVLVSPIAFVSEHVETLVELDHEYREVADAAGVSPYLRSRTPGVREPFIQLLAEAVLAAKV
jgi:hypothetical protein